MYLSDYISQKRQALIDAVDSLELTAGLNFEQQKRHYKAQYGIEPLELLEPEPSGPKEITRTRRNDWGENYEQKVFEVNVVIPFKGDGNLFDCNPSRRTIVYPKIDSIDIRNRRIHFTIILDQLDDQKYKGMVAQIKRELSVNIPQVNSEIASWTNGLDVFINQLFAKRKGIVEEKHAFMEKIGLKVNPEADEFITPTPITRKKIPQPVIETSKAVKKGKIPSLQQEVYDDIKEVLYNVGKAIEKKPAIYEGKYEEDLRDVFLLFLETRYEAVTGIGEAFNKTGRTDILLKHADDGSNLFVAECKVWRSKKNFIDGITQLLGYVTWRDSKTALLVFVPKKEIVEVIETAKVEINNHSQFKRHVSDSYDSSSSYEFTLPDDDGVTIQLEVMFFHFPKNS